jgi:hypothetical protein
MSTINKPLLGLLFGGAALPLGTAPFRNNLNAVYGFNNAGTGYTLFKPTRNFNSLQQLAPDSSYILDSATTGYELAGAILKPGSGAAGPTLTLAELRSGDDPATGYNALRCRLVSSVASNTTVNVLLAAPGGPNSACQAAGWLLGIPLGQLVDLPRQSIEDLGSGDVVELFAVAASGAVVHQRFELDNYPPTI